MHLNFGRDRGCTFLLGGAQFLGRVEGGGVKKVGGGSLEPYVGAFSLYFPMADDPIGLALDDRMCAAKFLKTPRKSVRDLWSFLANRLQHDVDIPLSQNESNEYVESSAFSDPWN